MEMASWPKPPAQIQHNFTEILLKILLLVELTLNNRFVFKHLLS